jgi:tetratricopeptide (TPR) repeat protein
MIICRAIPCLHTEMRHYGLASLQRFAKANTQACDRTKQSQHMNSERIKILEQFVAEDPTDPFNRYALALELAKSDRLKAKEILDQLINSNPDYVPAYYQAALLYLQLSLNEEATIVIEKGVSQAKMQRNQKAANELRGLLDEME